MAHEPASKPKTPSLPPIVASPADLGRLIWELKQIDDTLLQLGLRTGGSEVKVPKTSRLMDLVVEHNRLNLLKPADRDALGKLLVTVKEQAPQLHFSFGADPSAAFLEKLVTWLRQNIHPFVLVTIGLQPGIGAGCVMRSTNKFFDFSIGQAFVKKRELLLNKLSVDAEAAS